MTMLTLLGAGWSPDPDTLPGATWYVHTSGLSVIVSPEADALGQPVADAMNAYATAHGNDGRVQAWINPDGSVWIA